jgi:hypothetical protein
MVELPSVKFHENYKAVLELLHVRTDGQANIAKLISAFLQLFITNAP